MQLSTDQLARYRRDGFIVLPELLAPAEVAAMKAELQRLQGIDTDHLVRERVGGVAKTIYRVHEADGPTASPPFHAAARAPRLLAPARQLLGDESLYVYHTKCNLKTAIDGSVWAWHQDYGTWRRDGVPEANLTTALLMLDEPTEIGGCLYFIPGSHRVVPKPTLLEIMQRSAEPVPIVGKPGTVVFFHPNLLHASGHNLSRHDRWQVYIVYNTVANKPEAVPAPRPDYVRSTNVAPLQMGSDKITTQPARETA